MKLNLGVIDVPYSALLPVKGKKLRSSASVINKFKKVVKPLSPAAGTTTGDVAEILEAKYHVMQYFWDTHGQEGCDALVEDMMDAFADRASGRNIDAPDFTAATSKMHQMFNEFIDRRGMDGMPGVPTMAARIGINHRFLHPYAKANPERPSFKDTGLYMGAFTAWVEA
jgi:hypothetical protein